MSTSPVRTNTPKKLASNQKTAASPKTDQTSVIAKNTVIPLIMKWSEVQPVYAQATQKLSQRLKLPGFRKGKVPTNLTEQTLGFEKISQVVLDSMLHTTYHQALKAANKHSLTQPRIRVKVIDKGVDWELEAEIAEAPQVELKDYQKIIKTAQQLATKEWAEHLKEHAQAKPKAEESPTKPAVSEAATKSQPSAAAEDHHHGPEEERQFKLRVILGQLVSQLNPSLPELLITETTKAELDTLITTLDRLKVSLDDYLARRQLTAEQLTNQVAAEMIGKLQLEFILDALAVAEKMAVTPEEVAQAIAKMTDPQQKATHQKNPDAAASLERILIKQKVIDFLAKA